MQTVGIPRGLGFYDHYPLWDEFFRALGYQVKVSPPTNKRLLTEGSKKAVDEVCLPVKVYFGHALSLADQVDILFVPRLVSVEKSTYLCPKFIGLPDMIKRCGAKLPRFLDWTFNLRDGKVDYAHSLKELGRHLGHKEGEVRVAVKRAEEALIWYQSLLAEGYTPPEALAVMEGQEVFPAREGDLTIMLLGHAYQLYDSFISMNILQRLRKLGCRVITLENLPDEQVAEGAKRLSKRMFWSFGQRMLGGAFHTMETPIDGMIHVAAYGCGPDSMIGDLTERKARRKGNLPYMTITLDEHTGEAGVVTRLEAYIDMIRRRKERLQTT